MTRLTVRWAERARREFIESIDYISLERPLAAEALALRIADRIQALADNPLIGRPGRRAGTRELVLAGTPFIAIYRVSNDVVMIVRLLHGRRLWPPP